MFSSVEVEDRPLIVENCYWPLLKLIRKYDLPWGIEAPGCTLEFINEIDPLWISEFRELISCNKCEFIGSGYSQLIGPLVPEIVNRKNLLIGNDVYHSLLGIRPRIALINEQAYSSGILPLYSECDYKAIIMEWNNPYRYHPEWPLDYRYSPQKVGSTNNVQTNLIWNMSIAFQKFQRYAHGQIELDDIASYLQSHTSDEDRYFPLYGSDAEVFNFRPGRFTSEASLASCEWSRIESLIQYIQSQDEFSWASYDELLNKASCSSNVLTLESPEQPIPVKKQDKYNIVRWAVTGRNDLYINSLCHGICDTFISQSNTSSQDWKELCYLWSSDFRTHITNKRWDQFIDRLSAFQRKWNTTLLKPQEESPFTLPQTNQSFTWNIDGRFLYVKTSSLSIVFNLDRGLAVEEYIDSDIASLPIFGTLHHGTYDDISWGADFYSGHIIYQSPGHHQITDLLPCQPTISTNEDNILIIYSTIQTPLGLIIKQWSLDPISKDLYLSINIDWKSPNIGRLSIIPFTLFSNCFDIDALSYQVCNGGSLENFSLANKYFNHSKPVSFLVSSQHGLGMTNGEFAFYDNSKRLHLSFLPSEAAFFGQVQHQIVDNLTFTRFSLSASELDDTSKPHPISLVSIKD